MVEVEVRVEARALHDAHAPEGDQPSGDAFMLLEPWGERTWLASLGGRLVIARRVSDLSEVAPPNLSGAVGSAMAFGSRCQNLVPIIGLRAGAGALWLLSELDKGLPVQRLLEVTRFSPLQATIAATDILSGVASLHDGGACHGRITANNVLVGRTGSARLGDWAMEKVLPSSLNGDGQQVDLSETGSLLNCLVESARRSRHGLLDEEGHLALLDAVAHRLAHAPPGNGAVHHALDALRTRTNGRDQRARAELSSLVGALTRNPRWARYPEMVPAPPGNGNGNGNGLGNGNGNGHHGNGHHLVDRHSTDRHSTDRHSTDRHSTDRHSTDSDSNERRADDEYDEWTTGPVSVLTAPSETAHRRHRNGDGNGKAKKVPALPEAPPRPPSRVNTELRKAWRAVRLPVAVLLIVSLIVGVELAFLHNTIAKQLDLVFGHNGNSHKTASASSSTGDLAASGLPDPGPAASGSITGMDLRGVGPCNPGSVCQLRLLVLLSPSSSTQRLRWEFQVVDKCSGHPVTRPGNTAIARPDQSYVDTLSQVAIPAGNSLAVVAVTTSPARAASQPWLIGAGGPCGPSRAGTT